MPGTIGIIITALSIAARLEPYIAEVLPLVIKEIEKMHAEHDDTVMMTQINGLLKQFQIKPARVVEALQQMNAPGPEGQSQPQI